MPDFTFGIYNPSSADDLLDVLNNEATDGLSGTHGSLAYEVAEIEYHFHNKERWLFKRLVPVPNFIATEDPRTTVSSVWQIDAGNNDFGNWLQILSTDDTPLMGTNAYFDFHRWQVVAVERTSLYIIQVAWGANAATAYAAGDYTTFPFLSTSAAITRGAMDIRIPRIAVATPVWARCWNSNNTGTMDFVFGIHEYSG